MHETEGREVGFCARSQMWPFSDLCVPFLTVPPPAWPGPCRCCWSRFEGLGLFPSNQPAACLYPSAAPADSRSTRRATWDGVISQKHQRSGQDYHIDTCDKRRRSGSGEILPIACWAVSLLLRPTLCPQTGGGIATVIVFSGFLIDRYGVIKNTHGHTTTRAWTHNTPGCSKQNTSRCCWRWTQSSETQEVYKLVTKGQHIWWQDAEICSKAHKIWTNFMLIERK